MTLHPLPSFPSDLDPVKEACWLAWRIRSLPEWPVAVPVLNSALEQRFSILGGTGTGTKMEASIHLRAKDFAMVTLPFALSASRITSPLRRCVMSQLRTPSVN